MQVSVDELKRAVEDMHNCTAKFIEAVPVSQDFEGQPVWQGVVHFFDLKGHPQATHCYAWSSQRNESSKRRFYAVLEIPPVQSARDAVRAAIVAENL